MFARKLMTGALLTLLSVGAARADVKPNGLISEGMVLQQKTKVRVWGTADAGEKVTVKFRDQEASAEPDKDGRWSVQLDSKEAGGPFPMSIQGKNKIELKDVLVGEVWVCSGQSNMEWTINASNQSDKDVSKNSPANPMLRMFTVKKNPKDAPVADVTGAWIEAKPETVGAFSAVGYFFGRDLQAKLKVPVGMINSSWGGTRAEAWTSRSVLESNPTFKSMVEQHNQAVKSYAAAVEKAKAENAKPPADPAANPNAPSVLYNGMIAPLLPYAIKGSIWYQGESNVGRAYDYRTLFPMMIKNWRDDWKVGEFSFYFVQLAPFQAVVKEPGESAWAELCEAQLLTSKKTPHTGMAVITDFGHEADIHPTPKQPVGERLALLARAHDYGEKIEHSGPAFEEMKIDGNKAVLRFSHAGGGMVTRELEATDQRKDGKTGQVRGSGWRARPSSGGSVPLIGFAIAGEDKKFHTAQAKIEGDTVVVWSDMVSKPVAVRYAWASHPLCNLFNKEGLPASPFRTDDFPITTQPKK